MASSVLPEPFANLFDRITPVILAGGLGTRLKPVIKHLPKALAPVAGRPFIHYLFDQLLTAGFSQTILCVGFQADLVQEKLGSHYRDLTLKYSYEDFPLGTGGALRKALSLTREETLLVMNGDSYALIHLTSYCEWFIKKELKAAMVLGRSEKSARFGSVKLASNYLVESFQEKHSGENTGIVNAGIYLFDKRLIEKIPADCNFSLENQLFPKLANNDLYAYPHIIDFYDIGTPESYNNAGHFFLGLDSSYPM